MIKKNTVNFIYIERPFRESSLELTLLRDLSKKTFSDGHPLKTIVSENPAAIKVTDILKTCDSSHIALSLDDSLYYSKNWTYPLMTALNEGFDLAAPVCNDFYAVDMPYYTPMTFNEAAEYMLQKNRGYFINERNIPPLIFLLNTSSLSGLNLNIPLYELPKYLRCTVVPSSLVHRFGDYFGFLREDILPFIPDRVNKVLDVGCADGTLGEIIKRERGCEVYGVEINKNIADTAREKLDNVFCMDIETADLPFNGDMDVIIFADILEHLFSPWKVLENSARWLKPEGIVVASIPNIAHYSIISDLLRGRWDYIPSGLLCISHIRFFTRASIEDMFARSGYSILDIQPHDFPGTSGSTY